MSSAKASQPCPLSLRLCVPAGTKELFFFSPLLQGKQRSMGACQKLEMLH